MNAAQVRHALDNYKAEYWNHETMEYIFHDPQFDEPPERDDSSTYGITELDITRYKNGFFDCYVSDRDEDIDRDEAAERIANEYGWITVDDPLTNLYLRLAS